MERIEALAAHLGIELEEGETLEDYITEASYGENTFEAEGNEYLVLTDEEADKASSDNIRESLWAFNADFLSGNTDLPAEVFSMIRADRSEDANEVFTTLVTKCGDIHKLIEEAISSDGRGHYMNSYDGHEWEEGEYYIYRIN